MASTLELFLLTQVQFLRNKPQVRIYQATPQSVANATNVAITFDGSTTDTYGMHSTVTNNSRVTAVIAGWYRIGGVCAIGATSTTATTWAYFAKNGTDYTPITFSPSPLGGNNRVWYVTSDLVQLAVGDYVEMYVNQNDGVLRNTVVTSNQFSTMFVVFDHA